MNDNQVKEIKEAKRKIVDGGLTIWNTRLDMMFAAGRLKDILDHIGSPADGDDPDGGPNIPITVGCEACVPLSICDCPPNDNCSVPELPDERINEIVERLNTIEAKVSKIQEKATR